MKKNVENDDNSNSNKKSIIIFLIICVVVYSYYNQYKESRSDYKYDYQDNYYNTVNNDDSSIDKNDSPTDNKNVNTEKAEEIKIKYNELGKYGKKVFDEGSYQIFYYIPEGKYNITVLTRSAYGNDLCFLWLEKDSDNSIIEKLSFNQTNSNTVTIPSKSHIYNSNPCSYSLIKIN